MQGQSINTLRDAYFLKEEESYTIVNEDLEYSFEDFVLEQIADLFNNGFNETQIAKLYNRDPWEVHWAVCHLARKKKIHVPIGYRFV
ncbi:hypothetical protein [Gracilibacillus saliphilus]|uniref:hypothetical protein n=1 Tax=Gracilibacillus saliphilus TaxID=543890 RepID=UPI0013CF6E69|nr:hypothetical protein [Gracilibacillus saliphilus]